MISVFRGFVPGLAERPDSSPIRCKILAALPMGRFVFVGVNTPQQRTGSRREAGWKMAWVGTFSGTKRSEVGEKALRMPRGA